MAVTQGIDKDIAAKMAAKYDFEAEAKVTAWIEALTGEKCPVSEEDPERSMFGPWLQDGMVLCKLVNAIKEKSGETQGDGRLTRITKIHEIDASNDGPFMKSKKMDNITSVVKAFRTAGLIEQSNFATVSLLELKNLGQVVNAITCYSNLLKEMDIFEGPYIEAVKNVETAY